MVMSKKTKGRGTATGKIRPLNAREQLFVDHFLVSLSAEKAAREAGYSESTVRARSHEWVNPKKCPANKKHVIDAINEAKRKRSEKVGIDAEWVLRHAALIASFNIGKFIKIVGGLPKYDFSTATDDDWYCISEITTDNLTKGSGLDSYDVERIKIKPEAKLQALRMVGDHINVQAFKENLSVEISDRGDLLKAARERALERRRK